MMIDRSKFHGNERARLSYIVCLAAEEAEVVLREMLEDGGWRSAPTQWLQRAWYLEDRMKGAPPGIEATLLGELTAEILRASTLEDAHREVLRELVSRVIAKRQPQLLEALVSWFVCVAEPGDAMSGAEMLRSLPSAGDTRPLLSPLVAWMVERGGGELRSRGRRGSTGDPWLLSELIAAAVESNQRPLFAPLLRHFILADNPVRDVKNDLSIWTAVEEALEDGAPDSIATDVVGRLHLGDELWFNLFDGTWPKVQVALFTGLCSGVFAERQAATAWKHACARPAPSTLVFPNPAAVKSAMDALREVAAPLAKTAHEDDFHGWWEAAARGVLSLYRGDLAAAARVLQLYRGARGGAELGFANALNEALPSSSEEPTLSLARDILDSHPTAQFRAYPVLELLLTQTGSASAGSDLDLAPHARALSELVSRGWEVPVSGVDLRPLLGRATRVVFHQHEHGEQISIDGDVVRVQPGYIRSVAEKYGNGVIAHQLCALHFFHELVHHAQGIGDYANVKLIRGIGAESTLMHIDLTADHVAVELTAHARPAWDELRLRELVTESISSFPAGPFHTQASRLRKAYRLASSRVDFLVRRDFATRINGRDRGYLFAEFGLSGDAFLLFATSPAITLVAESTVSSNNIEALYKSVEPMSDSSTGLDGIDAVLRPVLERARWVLV